MAHGDTRRFAASLDALCDLSQSPTTTDRNRGLWRAADGGNTVGQLAGDSMSRTVWESRVSAALFPRYCAPTVTETGEIYSLCRGHGQHLALVRVLHF